MPMSFGGRSGQVPFPQARTDGGGQETNVLMEADEGQPAIAGSRPDFWGAKTRPMNKYMLSGGMTSADAKKMEQFHCPNDTGLPIELPVNYQNRESSWASGGIPFYDTVGNSYRINVAGAVQPTGAGTRGAVSVGPWGHRLSSLLNSGRLVMYAEPTFYMMSRQEANLNPEVVYVVGWHKKPITDQVSFVDGSARIANAQQLAGWSTQLLNEMRYRDPNGGQDWRYYLRRGDNWQMDCYPTPAALVLRYTNTGTLVTPHIGQGLPGGWPHTNIQNNMSPPGM